MLLELSLLRGLFVAGSNIAIDLEAGTISAAISVTSVGVQLWRLWQHCELACRYDDFHR